MKNLPKVDAAIIGGGWSGLLMAKELGARTHLSVAVIERGGPRKLADYLGGMDELEFNVRFRMMQDYSQETVTLRYNTRERAVPIRQLGNFLPGTGTGGAGEHWGAVCPRYVADLFELYTKTVERYGAKKLPEDHAIVDWGVTWNEIEPYYTRGDKLLGVSGKAGNIKGKLIAGGNPFEGPRSEDYPTPPMKLPYASALFEQAAKSLGYHPYPNPSATISQAYTNPDGISRPGCAYCGFCDRFGCMIGAKAQPTNTLLPLVEKLKSVSLRNNCAVRRIVFDKERQARDRRAVYRRQWRRVLPAGGSRRSRLLDAEQYAPDAALRHRPAVRSRNGQGRGRPQPDASGQLLPRRFSWISRSTASWARRPPASASAISTATLSTTALFPSCAAERFAWRARASSPS